MKSLRIQIMWVVSTLTLLNCCQALALDKSKVVRTAAANYYSLELQGLQSFQCLVVPDWQDYLEQKLEGYSEASIQEIKKIRFSASLNETGMLDLKPFSEGGGSTRGTISPVVNKLAELLYGFFQVIQINVIQTPFSILEKDFALTEKIDEYLIVMDDQDATSEMSLTKDYVIREIQVRFKSPEPSETVFWPKFENTDKGLLLKRLTTIRNDGQFMTTWDFLYKKVEGLQLPSSVVIKHTERGKTIRFKVGFEQYKISRTQQKAS